MKKAIHILLLLSKIFSLILAVVFGTMVIVSFCRCIGAEQSLVGKLIGEGVGYIFQCSFAIVASVLSFTREESISGMGPESKKDAIFCIVFGALSGCATLAAAGIVGLVYRSTVGTEKPAEPEQIEAPKDEE